MLAYISIPQPRFKFQSGFQSYNNNKGEEEEGKRERRKADCAPAVPESCQLSGLFN